MSNWKEKRRESWRTVDLVLRERNVLERDRRANLFAHATDVVVRDPLLRRNQFSSAATHSLSRLARRTQGRSPR